MISSNVLFRTTTTSTFAIGSYLNQINIRWLHHFQQQSSSTGTTFRRLPSKRQRRRQVPIVVDSEQSPFAAKSNVIFFVFVGMCSASFWRGAWYILDDVLFPNSKELSAISSLILGTTGMYSVQGLFERGEKFVLQLLEKYKSSHSRWQFSTRSLQNIHATLRFATIYSLVMSVVCIWRGTWMSWDILYAKYYNEYVFVTVSPIENDTIDNKTQMLTETLLNEINPTNATVPNIQASDPGHALRSGMLSHCTAIFILSSMGIVASVFAPPAAISVIRDNTIYSTKTSIERLLYQYNSKNRALQLQRQSANNPSWMRKPR